MSMEHQPESQQLATLPETGSVDITETMELAVVDPQLVNPENDIVKEDEEFKNSDGQLPIETPMDTNDADQSLDKPKPSSLTQTGYEPSAEMKYTGTKQPTKTKIRHASADSGQDGGTGSVKPLLSTSRPSSAPSFANALPHSKPISIFASLFPTNVPTAKSTDTPKSKTQTPPSGKLEKELTFPPFSGDTSSEISTSEKTVKSEMISDADESFPDSITAVAEAKTGSTGEILKTASPVSDGNSRDGVAVEKMDADSGHTQIPKPPATATEKSLSPNVVADVKSAAKHPPIAGKTIKKEQRKTSNSSPTIPGELKKAQRTKSTSPKVKKKPPPPKDDGQDGRNDFYCWVCHKEGEVLCCELCPRVFHAKCLNMKEEPEGDWFCPECEKVTEAECKDTQSRAMSMLTIDQFSLLLKYVIQRMKIPLSEPFHEAVDTKMFPDYRDYVFHPMDLSAIERNVKKRKYGCPEAFLGEFRWVVHNCVIYNSPHSKLTQNAKAMLKVAERELNEIEVCPECYLNSCRKRENWFCEPCKELHPLVWAKLQGFPHWPAKALRIDKGMVDVRFFGQHDRAWIPLSGCYLISKELPLPVKNKKKSKGPGVRGGLDGAMQELQVYIENIKKMTGEFEYAPPRTLLSHCDLYRKAGSVKIYQSARQQSEGDNKSAGTSSKIDGADITAKLELKDIGSGKESIKVRTAGSKKGKTVTTSGEHPTRSFGPKKKKASMEFLSKTIESCKASLGIEKIQDVRMNSGSDETSSSSDDEEMDAEVGDEKPGSEEITSTSGVTSTKPAADEDDSDAELVIDLGDMEESRDAAAAKNSKNLVENPTAKVSDGMVKKRKPEYSTNKPFPSTTKPPIKSILLNASKPTDESERKKMLAKALSEKIGGKRKHDGDAASSPSGNPSFKSRKTIEQQDKLGSSLSDVGQKKIGPKEKEGKKSHSVGKYLEKETSGKIRPGILKSSVIDPGQRKDSYSSEKKVSDPSKHKHKDGPQKSMAKKVLPSDKSGKIDKIPTEADTRKLFNGGRIPRKNPVVPVSDGEEQDHSSNFPVMETNQTVDPRKNTSNMPAIQRPTRQVGLGRQISTEHQRKTADENITLASMKKYSDKVMDTVQKVFYEMYTDMMVPLTSGAGSETSTAASATAMHEVAQMRLQLERLKWMHEQEIAELKHNHDLTVAEIRQSLEFEKKQLLLDAKVQAETAKNRAVEETKRKQWCAYCNKEAIFYCCWNTSYCDYPCQQKHWPQHMNSCTQARDSAASGQHAAPESMMTSPSHSASATKMNQASPLTDATSSTHVAKPPAMSSVSAGMATITIMASPRNLSRLNSVGKSTTATALPADSASSVKLSTKPVVVAAANSSTKLQVSVASQQQKSGSAISAIGARLLAAKQRSTGKEQSRAPSSKSENPPIPSSTAPAMSIPEESTDHVIATMESPLSPDAKPSSQKTSTTSLSISEKVQKSIEKVLERNDKDKTDTKQSVDKVQTPKLSTFGAKSDVQNPMQPSVSESTPITTAALSNIKAPKTHSKSTFPPSKAVFSSPSAVVSLIADMRTSLSSTSSSQESLSYSDTPEKKTGVPKVQLSLGGSAFTKVVADTPKIPTHVESTVRVKGPTSPLHPPSGSPAFKPVEMDHTSDSSTPKDAPLLHVVAPVLADSYLTSLKTLPPKTTKTPPIEAMDDDPPATKSQLPRPILPESDEDKSTASDAKVTSSDSGEPMDTDNKD